MTPRSHPQLAERGKRLALQGRHREALEHYRQAMHQAGAVGAPPILMRHYLECALESMELAGLHDAVLSYCEEAIEHYRGTPPASDLTRADLAQVYQRRAVNLAKAGDNEAAREACAVALRLAAEIDLRLPLAERLAAWLRGGVHIPSDRLTREQRRHHYFSVRRETVGHSARADSEEPVT
jgi:tetratricopeptide (TPR) repeat protein